jgi:hypothetical protein
MTEARAELHESVTLRTYTEATQAVAEIIEAEVERPELERFPVTWIRLTGETRSGKNRSADSTTGETRSGKKRDPDATAVKSHRGLNRPGSI